MEQARLRAVPHWLTPVMALSSRAMPSLSRASHIGVAGSRATKRARPEAGRVGGAGRNAAVPAISGC